MVQKTLDRMCAPELLAKYGNWRQNLSYIFGEVLSVFYS